MNSKICHLGGYYTVKSFKYCYLVSWRVKDYVPGNYRGLGRLRRFLCRHCLHGQGYPLYEKDALQRHLLDEHGIEVDQIDCGYKGPRPEYSYMLIPPEDFVKGGGNQMYPDEMLKRWVHAYELHRVQNPRLLSHWNEAFWLELICTVKKVQGSRGNNCRKYWNLVAEMLPPDLVAKFSSAEVKLIVVRSRFANLRLEVRDNRKSHRYNAGVTEPVIRAMKHYLKNTRDGADCKNIMKESFTKGPDSRESNMGVNGHSTKSATSMHFSEQLDREVNSLILFLDEQLFPTANHGLDSCLGIKSKIFAETETTPKVFKLAIKVGFQQMRAEIISKVKQTTCSLSQEIDKELKKAD